MLGAFLLLSTLLAGATWWHFTLHERDFPVAEPLTLGPDWTRYGEAEVADGVIRIHSSASNQVASLTLPLPELPSRVLRVSAKVSIREVTTYNERTWQGARIQLAGRRADSGEWDTRFPVPAFSETGTDRFELDSLVRLPKKYTGFRLTIGLVFAAGSMQVEELQVQPYRESVRSRLIYALLAGTWIAWGGWFLVMLFSISGGLAGTCLAVLAISASILPNDTRLVLQQPFFDVMYLAIQAMERETGDAEKPESAYEISSVEAVKAALPLSPDHFLMFMVAGFVITRRRRLYASLLLLLTLSTMAEMAQHFIDDRNVGLSEWVANLAGGGAGGVLRLGVSLLARPRRRIDPFDLDSPRRFG